MTCTFCHNEGTPVVADNVRRTNDFVAAGASGRVSIYLATNGAQFLPATVAPDAAFAQTLVALRDALHLDELHLTGGEPTLHPQLSEIVRIGTEAGLRVGVTSNGERGAAVLEDCAKAGLDRINFSIFGTTAEELAQVQHARLANVRGAERKLAALTQSITVAERLGVPASANIVVPGYDHAPRVRRLLDEYTPWLSVRLLNSLDDGTESITAIERILEDIGAQPSAYHVTAGVSGSRTAYQLPAGRDPLVQTDPTRPPAADMRRVPVQQRHRLPRGVLRCASLPRRGGRVPRRRVHPTHGPVHARRRIRPA